MAKAINAEFSDDEDEDDDNKSNWDEEEKVRIMIILCTTLSDINFPYTLAQIFITVVIHFYAATRSR